MSIRQSESSMVSSGVGRSEQQQVFTVHLGLQSPTPSRLGTDLSQPLLFRQMFDMVSTTLNYFGPTHLINEPKIFPLKKPEFKKK